MIGDKFNWLSDDSVVIQRVDAVAVYINERRDVVIRQENQMGDDDSVVIIPARMLGDLIDALQNVTS